MKLLWKIIHNLKYFIGINCKEEDLEVIEEQDFFALCKCKKCGKEYLR